MTRALREHWPEYLCEAAELGLFMISASLFTILLWYPSSPVPGLIPSEFVRRMLTGIAMGGTAVTLVFSPLGKRSGGHFNPAVTLTFWRLGKVKTWDAVFYVVAQFVGGMIGITIAALLLRMFLADPAVHYVATLPGPRGPGIAFIAELVIAFILMSVVLRVSNTPFLSRYTALFSGALVATFITFESPLSGMSMNPARTFASAFGGHLWTGLWIYFAAPLIAMQAAAWVYVTREGKVHCAKFHHHNDHRCIFNCEFADLAAQERGTVAGIADAGHRVHRPRLQTLSLIIALFVLSITSGLAQSIAVDGVGITVGDMDRSIAFYSALTFQKASDVEVLGEPYEKLEGVFGARMRIVRMQLGTEHIDLIQYLAPPGRPIPVDSHSNDLWFQHIAIVVRDMDQAFAKVRELKAQFVSTAPQILPASIPAAAGIKAFYFRDPDQHNLEIIYFPPGKGDPRWQGETDKIFLGIDHTAIGISNTDASLKFYRDLLGLRKAGESENFGTEQEHLNQVAGAHLRITGMRATAGPGVEFLEYLAPRDGRPLPADVHANDIVHWQTVLSTNDVDGLAKTLSDAHVGFVSPGVVSMPKDNNMFSKGALVRDPDGHDVLVIQAK